MNAPGMQATISAGVSRRVALKSTYAQDPLLHACAQSTNAWKPTAHCLEIQLE